MSKKDHAVTVCLRIKTTAGFTLVEILIVISILVMMATLLWGGMASYADRQTFRSTVGDVKSGIVSVRQKTIASENDTVHGFYASSTAVVFFEGATYTEGDPDNETIDMPTNITATSTLGSGVQSVVFSRLSGTASATGTLTFFDLQADAYATITINATGLVE